MQENVLKQKLRAKRICAAIAKGVFLLVLFLVILSPTLKFLVMTWPEIGAFMV